MLYLSIILAPALSPLVLFLKQRRYLIITTCILMAAAAIYILLQPEHTELVLLNTLSEVGMAPLQFTLHPYGRAATFGFLMVGAAGLLYGLDIMTRGEQAVALWTLSAALGVVFSGNFLTFFFFWELLTVSAAVLIYLKRSPESLIMGSRFLIIQLAGGLCLLAGILQNFSVTGSLELAVPVAGLPLFILGIGVKTAFIPLHLWLPWGYPAASFPVSVLLSALSTKVGVYAVARILPAHSAIALMGAVMALFGVILAVMQTDLRKLLSFHIISQVGYMVAGAGLGLAASVDGAMLHMVNHMVYKGLLFMCAGALIYTVGTENLHLLQGSGSNKETPIRKAVPLALIGAVAGALAIAGVPPFNGYVSKYILKYAVQGSGYLEWMLLLAGVGTALSFSKFVYYGFIKSRGVTKKKLPVSMTAAIAFLSTATIILGLLPGITAPLLPYGSSVTVYSLSGIINSLIIVAIGVTLFIPISRLLNPAKHQVSATPGMAQGMLVLQDIFNGFKAVAARLENISRAQIQLIFALVLTISLSYVFFYLHLLK